MRAGHTIMLVGGGRARRVPDPSRNRTTPADDVRHTRKVLRAGLLAAVGILVGSSLLAAGGCAASQTDPSRSIAQAINSLPGVDSTTHSFSIGWYDTFTMHLDANVRPGITPEQLTAIWEVFTRQAESAGADHAHFDVRLTINDCPSTVAPPDRYCGRISATTDGESAEPVPDWREWQALIRGHYGNDIHVNTSHVNGQSHKQITVTLAPSVDGKPRETRAQDFSLSSAASLPTSPVCARRRGPPPLPVDRHRRTRAIWNSVPRGDGPPRPSWVSGKHSPTSPRRR